MSTSGLERRREFEKAPAATQSEFLAAIARRTEWEHELECFRASVANIDAFPPVEMRRCEPPRVRWNDGWRRKAESRRFAERCGLRREGDFEAQRDRLKLIDPPEYVLRLTGQEPNHSGYLCCPLPDHEERTPSFHAYPQADRGWYCHGCSRGGNIYSFAGFLWGIDPRSGGFREIHQRLLEVWV